MQNEDGPTPGDRNYAERALEKDMYAAKRGALSGIGLGGQSRPPDPLEEQAQAWRLYGAFLEIACRARDAFARAKLNQPAPLAVVLDEADGQTIAEGKD